MKEELLIKYNFFSTVICDILKTIESSALTGACILTFCGIDYMGLALKPELSRNTKSEFKKYLIRYMSILDLRYKEYADHIYAIRCSFVHSYGPSDATKKLDFMPFLMYYEPIRYHHLLMETVNNQKRLNVVLPDLVSDFILSVKFFFEEQEGHDFSIWLSKLFYQTSILCIMNRKEILKKGYFNYEEIHPILKILDSNQNIKIQREFLVEEFTKLISPCV